MIRGTNLTNGDLDINAGVSPLNIILLQEHRHMP